MLAGTDERRTVKAERTQDDTEMKFDAGLADESRRGRAQIKLSR
jgi:hypothetical protein